MKLASLRILPGRPFERAQGHLTNYSINKHAGRVFSSVVGGVVVGGAGAADQ